MQRKPGHQFLGIFCTSSQRAKIDSKNQAKIDETKINEIGKKCCLLTANFINNNIREMDIKTVWMQVLMKAIEIFFDFVQSPRCTGFLWPFNNLQTNVSLCTLHNKKQGHHHNMFRPFDDCTNCALSAWVHSFDALAKAEWMFMASLHSSIDTFVDLQPFSTPRLGVKEDVGAGDRPIR